MTLPNLQKLTERERSWDIAGDAPWTVTENGVRVLHAGTYPGTPDPRPSAAEQDARLAAAAPALAEEIVQDEAAFAEIGEQQQKALSIARTHGFVFDEIGNDPGNWQHLAFTYYTIICEVDSMARAALARLADFDGRIK